MIKKKLRRRGQSSVNQSSVNQSPVNQSPVDLLKGYQEQPFDPGYGHFVPESPCENPESPSPSTSVESVVTGLTIPQGYSRSDNSSSSFVTGTDGSMGSPRLKGEIVTQNNFRSIPSLNGDMWEWSPSPRSTPSPSSEDHEPLAKLNSFCIDLSNVKNIKEAEDILCRFRAQNKPNLTAFVVTLNQETKELEASHSVYELACNFYSQTLLEMKYQETGINQSGGSAFQTPRLDEEEELGQDESYDYQVDIGQQLEREEAILKAFSLELNNAADERTVQEIWVRFQTAHNFQVQEHSVAEIALNPLVLCSLAVNAEKLVKGRLGELQDLALVDMTSTHSSHQEPEDDDQQPPDISQLVSVLKLVGLLGKDVSQFDGWDFSQKAFQTAIGAGMGYAYWKLSDDKSGSSGLQYLLSPVSALINGALYEVIAERILGALKEMLDECYDDDTREFQYGVFCKYFCVVVPLLLVVAAIPSAPMLAASLTAGTGYFSYFAYVMRTIATAQSLPTIYKKFCELRDDLKNVGCVEAAATILAFLCAIIYTLAQHSSISEAGRQVPGFDRYKATQILLEVIAILALFPFNLNWSAAGLKVALGIQRNDASNDGDVSNDSTEEDGEENEEERLKDRVSLILLAFLSGLPSVAMVEAGDSTQFEKKFQLPIDVASYVTGSLMNLASIFLNFKQYSGCISKLMGLVVKLMAIVVGAPVVGAYNGLSHCCSAGIGQMRESIGLSLHTRPGDVDSNREGVQSGGSEESKEGSWLSYCCFGKERGESNAQMLGQSLLTQDDMSNDDQLDLMEERIAKLLLSLL